jgi:hypothetical protein
MVDNLVTRDAFLFMLFSKPTVLRVEQLSPSLLQRKLHFETDILIITTLLHASDIISDGFVVERFSQRTLTLFK